MKCYSVGADPELFLTNADGQFVSAIGKFGGTKSNPRPIPGLRNGFAVQEDNVAVEFNIPPVFAANNFSENIQLAMEYINECAIKLKLKVTIVPSASFPENELNTPEAKHFGCEPDYNVWTLEENPRPHTKDKTLRSAGGHVHIGYKEDNIGLGRACDLFLGCPSILFDADTKRRLLYGKAGAIRIKPYGIEYRTLSNFWIKSRPWTEMVFHQAQQAAQFVDKGNTIPDEDARLIVRCINNSDQNILKELTNKYKLVY